MRYGINGSGQMLTRGVAGVLDDLRSAEDDGFSSYWVAQVGLIDALTLLSAHGDTGSPMQLGTAVTMAQPSRAYFARQLASATSGDADSPPTRNATASANWCGPA